MESKSPAAGLGGEDKHIHLLELTGCMMFGEEKGTVF